MHGQHGDALEALVARRERREQRLARARVQRGVDGRKVRRLEQVRGVQLGGLLGDGVVARRPVAPQLLRAVDQRLPIGHLAALPENETERRKPVRLLSCVSCTSCSVYGVLPTS